ncbi:C-type lectin domain family 4 member E-like [Sceloporus undulatus]|uniref:C-type lectin domain family 4 member E-like n=1 Tax=Sceloporus undulatus TaxID=8520 RepID=UPI001C4CF4B1|nr:C-type lectin domain family 4 member E-like [Sceloporus undulatus]
MATEVTYAEINFMKTPPPVDPKASSKPRTPLNVFQRIPSWFPWVMSGFLLLLSIALLIVILVSPKEWLKKTPHKNLPSNSTEWHCLLKSHGGSEQELSCCKEGWQQFQSRCYSFSKDTATWNNSRMKCVDMDSNLVVINSETEQEFLRNQTVKRLQMKQERPQTENFCIGLSDQEEKGRWQWVDQTPIDPAATLAHIPTNPLCHPPIEAIDGSWMLLLPSFLFWVLLSWPARPRIWRTQMNQVLAM